VSQNFATTLCANVAMGRYEPTMADNFLMESQCYQACWSRCVSRLVSTAMFAWNIGDTRLTLYLALRRALDHVTNELDFVMFIFTQEQWVGSSHYALLEHILSLQYDFSLFKGRNEAAYKAACGSATSVFNLFPVDA
jgi:hypothetical protein